MAVQYYGPDSGDAVSQLVYILRNDPDSTLRSYSAMALLNVTVHDRDIKAVVEALADQLDRNVQVPVRFLCAYALARFEDECARPPVMLALIKGTSDKGSWEIREASCRSLARIFTNEKHHVPVDMRAYTALVTALSDPASKVRQQALISVLSLGKSSNRELQEKLIARLKLMLNDRQGFISVWAYYGLLVNVGVNETYLGGLVKLLQSGDVPTRVQAIRALGMLAKEARAKIPEIVAAVKDPDPVVAATACMTLAAINEKISPPTPDAAETIKAVADDKKADETLRKVAQQAYDILTGKVAVKPGKQDRR
jgi:HEAT repeat protein